MHCYLLVFLGLFEPFRRNLTISEGGLHLGKWVTLGKRVRTLGKIGHTWKNGSYLEKWVILYLEKGSPFLIRALY